MSLQTDFDDAVVRSRSLPSQPPQNLLRLYALFKQATEGDVSGSRPGMLDVKGRAKYDAWAEKKGTSKDDAMSAYVALVRDLGGG
jgi:acyl-CoA-binding protein